MGGGTRHVFVAACFGLAAVCATGCRSPYAVQRTRDAADCLTATWTTGSGMRLRAGPLHAGLYGGRDLGGLRAGTWTREFYGPFREIIDVDLLLTYEESFADMTMATAQERGKFFRSQGVPVLCVCRPETGHWHHALPFYGQAEVAVGLVRGAKLGINVIEILDFVLGWAALDPLRDDLSR